LVFLVWSALCTATETVTFTAGEDTSDSLSLTRDGITLTMSAGALYNQSYYRLDKNATLTITAPAGTLSRIVIAFNNKNLSFTASEGNYYSTTSEKRGVWNGSTDQLTLTNKAGASMQLKSVTVTYTPRISYEADIFSTGYATFYYGTEHLMLPDGLTAFTCHWQNGAIVPGKTYVAGDVIPAGEAVVLQGSQGTYAFTAADTAGGTDAANLLCGADEEVTLSDEGWRYFILSLNKAGDPASVGFYYYSADGKSVTSGAHKAWLQLPEDVSDAKEYPITSGQITSRVPNILNKASLDKAAVYDLSGRQFTADRPQKPMILISSDKKLTLKK